MSEGTIGMTTTSDQTPRMKILLVEDNADDADLLRRTLDDVGSPLFDLTQVERLEQALTRIRTEKFDAILLDLSLPDSQGLETVAKMTVDALSVPIVVLTGLDDERVGLAAIRKGAQDYLVKGRADGNLVSRVIRHARERKWSEQRLKDAIRELAKSRQELLGTLAELNESHAQLKVTQLELVEAAKMESVGRLAAGIAHEVKNPLATLVMGLDYLQAHVSGTNGTLTQLVKNMTDAAMRADTIISQLQQFSMPEALEVKVADLNTITSQALSLVRHEFNKHGIQVNQEFQSDLPQLWLDANKIEQVFINVFMNAIESMKNAGTFTVRTYTKQLDESDASRLGGGRADARFGAGGHVVVAEMEDTGTGIPEDKLEKIFDPFFTTAEMGRTVGLGLTVAKKIVELHEGRIKVDNRETQGVRVTIVFKT